MEHRWGNRFAAEIEVRLFAFPASAGCGRIRDISITGACIETAVPLPSLSSVHITLARDAHVLHAMVVRRTASGIAVEWTDADPDIVAALVREARAAASLPVDSAQKDIAALASRTAPPTARHASAVRAT
jgi:hypothetical protein